MAAEESVKLKENGDLVESLWHTVDGAAGNLGLVPKLVRRLLETGAWRKRIHRGRSFEHERFVDFITAKPLAGCGWPIDKVQALIKDDAVTLEMWRDAVTADVGRPRLNTDNVSNLDDGHGNSKSYTLSRLKRLAPALFDRVVAGDLSANAAAIEAGFRTRQTPIETIRRLIPKLTDQERIELRRLLEGQPNPLQRRNKVA